MRLTSVSPYSLVLSIEDDMRKATPPRRRSQASEFDWFILLASNCALRLSATYKFRETLNYPNWLMLLSEF